MEIFLQTDTWIALLTLTFLEIVLGIDNIIFISIISNKLPPENQKRTRTIGLVLALFFRIGMLFGLSYLTKLKHPFYTFDAIHVLGYTIPEFPVTGRSIILLVGGLFLLAKSVTEIFNKIENKEHATGTTKGKKVSVAGIIVQIILLDIVFSFDSILTAVGLSDEILIMIIAVVISMVIMLIFSGKISRFINKHPSLQMLALAFLILIGFMLVLEAVHIEIPKGYIYFAIFFSLIVELINMRRRKRSAGTEPH